MRQQLFCAALMACAVTGPAGADGMPVTHHHYYVKTYRQFRLAPERHVLERRPEADGTMLINGRWFRATNTPGCYGWAAGQPIRLLEGDWHGYCSVATFYNLRLHATCPMVC